MKAFIATLSAAVLGFSSLIFVNTAIAGSISYSVVDGTITYDDTDYSDTDYSDPYYSDTPVYIVTNSWSPPPGYYSDHHERKHWRKAHHRGHKHHGRHNGRHYRHHNKHYR